MTISEPDYVFWDGVNEFLEWQVVCLWSGIEPSTNWPQEGKAQVIQIRLTEARKNDRLHSEVRRTDFVNAKSDYQVWYQRKDLIDYATLDCMKPAFLFPEIRNTQKIALPENANNAQYHTDTLTPIVDYRGSSDTEVKAEAEENNYRTPPGIKPRVGSRKMAIKAAWEIEFKSGRAASAKEVMSLLKTWAADGTEPNVLIESVKENNAVKWLTTKGAKKTFDLEACGKTLETWNKSRQ